MHIPDRCCLVCANEIGVDDIPAEFQCETCQQHLCLRDSRLHLKHHPHHMIKKLNHDLWSSQTTPPPSSHPLQYCQLHQCPINAFCETCRQLVCSACGLSSQHKSHACVLLSEIDQEMRQELENEIDELKQLKKKWETECDISDENLNEEIQEIEKQQQILKNEIEQAFQELHQCLEKRSQLLKEEVDKLCFERICFISKMKELKQQTNSSLKEFEKLHEMTTFEMMNRKINSLEIAKKDLTKMVEEFNYSSVKQFHELKYVNNEKELNELKNKIELFGEIDSSLSLSSNRLQNKEICTLVVGLDDAGKTTILYKLKLDEIITTTPTVGFNVETVQYKKINFTMWDVGGQDKIRPLWRHYYANTKAVIFVVDSNDRDRVQEARNELQNMLSNDEMCECVVLILANKQDLPNAMSVVEMTDRFRLHDLRQRKRFIQPCCALSGQGLFEGLDWLSEQFKFSSQLRQCNFSWSGLHNLGGFV